MQCRLSVQKTLKIISTYTKNVPLALPPSAAAVQHIPTISISTTTFPSHRYGYTVFRGVLNHARHTHSHRRPHHCFNSNSMQCLSDATSGPSTPRLRPFIHRVHSSTTLHSWCSSSCLQPFVLCSFLLFPVCLAPSPTSALVFIIVALVPVCHALSFLSCHSIP